jgi:hypothetical protein
MSLCPCVVVLLQCCVLCVSFGAVLCCVVSCCVVLCCGVVSCLRAFVSSPLWSERLVDVNTGRSRMGCSRLLMVIIVVNRIVSCNVALVHLLMASRPQLYMILPQRRLGERAGRGKGAE